jgi:hypothetical protein
MPDHKFGFEILTKHKEAIRQLRFIANWGTSAIAKVYKTGRSTINRILKYSVPAIEVILEDFGLVTAELVGYIPLFIEDSNPVYSYKSITNSCTVYREKHGIQLFNYLSTSPDLNPIEKCWRAIKQSLHRRKIQPTNEIDTANAIVEEWNALDQE